VVVIAVSGGAFFLGKKSVAPGSSEMTEYDTGRQESSQGADTARTDKANE